MQETEERAHVAAIAFPFGGHANSLLSIVHRLAELSPATRFSFFSTRSSNSAAFSRYATSLLPSNLKAYDVWDGVPEGYVFKVEQEERVDLFMEEVRRSLFREGLKRAVEESGRRVTCLVTDAFFWFGREVAEGTGGVVPWLTFWACCSNSLSAHVYTDFLRETFGTGEAIAGREDELLKPIPGMSKIRVRDLPEGVVSGKLDSVFSEMLRKMSLKLPLADAVIINSFEEMTPEFTADLKSKFKSYLNIGPFNLLSPPPKAPDTYNCVAWLNKQPVASVTYVAFGSVAVPPPAELAAIAEALEAKNVPFLWSLKDSARAHLPDGFLERTRSQGMAIPWAPQTEVLEHQAIGAFITHGGWLSVLESVAGGVPMICRPFFGDHGVNARMVEQDWEIGVGVKSGTLSKDELIYCLDEILFGEGGKKMRDALRRLKSQAMAAVGPQGSSSFNFDILLQLVRGTKKL